jgi:AcrR family transcriptional regulator
MAQYLKDDVQQSIVAAALQVFARKGYVKATMAEIARAARISTGNIYRYYENKDELFRAVVSDAFVRRFTRLLRRRMTSLLGVDDIRTLKPTAVYYLASAEFLTFCIENRLRVVVLLGRAHGSRYERFADGMLRDLIYLALAHFRSVRPHAKVTGAMRFNLDHIYRSLVASMVTILTTFEDEATIREAVGGYSKYHLAGLKAFFG